MELKGYIVKIFVTKKMEKNLVVKPNLNTGHKKKKKREKNDKPITFQKALI